MDCMEAMVQMPDKAFDLAIVDPPYGIDLANMNMGIGKSKRASKIENRNWKPKNWDNYTPDQSYFMELFRISHNQIIWGGNYFHLPPNKYFVVWDKGEGLYGRSFSECEYAWSSIGSTRIFKHQPVQKQRIHPTQKPIKLYEWLLKNYAKDGWTILDTHLGSGSSRIAADKMGFDFVGYELDTEYFEAQEKRFAQYKSQLTLGL